MPEPTLAELIIPCAGRVAVEVDVPSERTPSGLYLLEETARTIHENRPIQGRIIAVHNQRDDDPISPDADDDLLYPEEFAVGDWVVFGKFSGAKISRSIEVDGKREKQAVIILNTSDILCKLRTPSQVSGLKVKA